LLPADRGIPYSYRHMHGFGSHTFSFINSNNERFWVRLHLATQQGIRNLTDAEAEAIVGKDRESHQRDLYESIERGDFPRWKMSVPIMPEREAAKCRYNPFDLTKVWFHKDYPLRGVEQSAFNSAQGRLFSYGDAQRYRLGTT